MANHPHQHAAPAPDKAPAFVGLVSAVIFLLVVVFTIVTLTNKHYAGEKSETPAAATH